MVKALKSNLETRHFWIWQADVFAARALENVFSLINTVKKHGHYPITL